jgi:hypothetical protein
MSGFEFSKSGQVEIQGKYALNLISLKKSAVEFEIIGLSNPTVHLIDKRPEVKKMTTKLLETGRVEKLAQYFNKPALIRVLPSKGDKLSILLEKTRAKKPIYTLWVAVGIRGKIPYYDNYIRLQIEPARRKDTFSLFYLFKNDQNNENAA